MPFHVPEPYRVTVGALASDATYGNNGMFSIPTLATLGTWRDLRCIASDGLGWEHVSVSLAQRTGIPTWREMCLIKELFWDPDDTVMQLHPPRSEWISNHPGTLHLWRPTHHTIPRPPGELVGYADSGELTTQEARQCLKQAWRNAP